MKFVFILSVFSLMLACSPSSSRNDLGDLSYNFTINRDCQGRFCKPEENEKCETKKSFESQAAFCEGLRDASLNAGCARRERKSLYFSKCGPSFEDSNIPGWKVACQSATDQSSLEIFPDRKAYCDDLNSPNHTDCSAGLRNEQTERYECSR